MTVRTGTNLYVFPTVLAKAKGSDEWYAGYEAEYFAGQNRVEKAPPLVKALDDESSWETDGARIEAAELAAVFIRESLKILGLADAGRSISGICITTEHLTASCAKGFRKAFSLLNMNHTVCYVQDMKESFYYYGYSQRSSICVRNMAFLVFREEEADFYVVQELRGKRPYPVIADMRKTVHLPADPEARDDALKEAAAEIIQPGSFSGVFITGEGFSTEWAVKSVREMSRGGAHVFETDCLAARGACWTLVQKLEKKSIRGKFYMGPDLVRTSVGIDVSDCGKPVWYPLIRAGENWYEAEEECDIILDDRNDITVTAVTMDGENHDSVRFFLDGIPERPPKATRIRLKAMCPDSRTCRITAEDLGFGELFEKSGLTWSIDVDIIQ